MKVSNDDSKLQSNESEDTSLMNNKNYKIQDLIQENMQASKNITLWLQKNQEKNKIEQ